MSKFSLKVEFKRTGYWSITVIDFLKSFKAISVSYLPSINIYPSLIYVIYKRVFNIVDFPEPVRPTTPTFYPFSITTFRELMTFGRSGRYLTDTFLNYILPDLNISPDFSYSSFHSLQYLIYFSYGERFINLYNLSREISCVSNSV